MLRIIRTAMAVSVNQNVSAKNIIKYGSIYFNNNGFVYYRTPTIYARLCHVIKPRVTDVQTIESKNIMHIEQPIIKTEDTANVDQISTLKISKPRWERYVIFFAIISIFVITVMGYNIFTIIGIQRSCH